jgi:CHASE2 domain-containing sensor protein
MLGPEGQILPLPVSLLRGSPFANYFMPGLVLFAGLGVGPLVAAGLVWRRHPRAPLIAIGVGIILLIWMGVEIAIIGYSNHPPLQPFYLAFGALMTSTGIAWRVTLMRSAARQR